MTNLFNLIVSLLATTTGAISGIGGGIIIKPVYDAFSGLPISTINFMSGCTVFSMSIVSLLKSRNSGVKLDKVKSTTLALGAAVGGIIGKQVFQLTRAIFKNDNLIGAGQAIILIIMTLYVFWFIKNKEKIIMKNVENLGIAAIIGFSLGMISAFLGIGGGPINIAILAYFFNMDSKTCSLNSIYIIFFSQTTSLLTTFITKTVPTYNSMDLIFMIIGGIAGGFIGSTISKRLSNKGVDKIFSVVLIVILMICTYNFFRFI
jgi:uncharacterized membrane protein YfcA